MKTANVVVKTSDTGVCDLCESTVWILTDTRCRSFFKARAETDCFTLVLRTYCKRCCKTEEDAKRMIIAQLVELELNKNA